MSSITHIPGDILPPLTQDQIDALIADALEMHQTDDDRAPYMAGWTWGVVCGFCGTLALFAACMAVGYAVGLIF